MTENLRWLPAADRPDLLAGPVAAVIADVDAEIAEIDPDLSDTAAFCARYGVAMGDSANCVLVAGRRAGETRTAACMVLATTRADVNGAVRRLLDVRKASFAAMDDAVASTGMEYGGITPVGLPAVWSILVDAAVADHPRVVIGSGVRRSKLAVSGATLLALPAAHRVGGLARPVAG